MTKNCKVYNLESFTDVERIRVEALINQIEQEKKNKRWWIMPAFDAFDYDNPRVIKGYYVEEQKESYSKSRPPLQKDFKSEEDAKRWLQNYLEEDKTFNNAIMQIDNLVCNLGKIKDMLSRHKMISEDDWYECFRLYNESRLHGELGNVTK